ncbi:glycosyltransferase family 1 protein, partial [Streptomyces sp. 12297]
ELRARIGAAGRERVLERFTWAKAAEGTVAHYRAAIARAAGPARTGSAALTGSTARTTRTGSADGAR